MNDHAESEDESVTTSGRETAGSRSFRSEQMLPFCHTTCTQPPLAKSLGPHTHDTVVVVKDKLRTKALQVNCSHMDLCASRG